jgi:hypothetical protein
LTRAAALAALAMALAGPRGAQAGDPRLEHFTIETAHFAIHYAAPLAALARRAAVAAERAHRTLAPALDHVPTEKTQIALIDDTDGANGFASVLPRNAITLFATAPGSFTELDDHDDWLYALIVHEYTHILHLDTMEGLPSIVNRVLGKSWAPNQVLPRWLIEGIAVYEESKRTAGGRNRGTRFDQFIRTARRGGQDLRLDEVTGAPRRFPRGNASYVYGSRFVRYVLDRFGDDALRAMSHSSGAFPLPFATSRPFAKVTGRPVDALYRDWQGYVRDRYGLQEQAAERRGLVVGRPLTLTGDVNVYPQYSADGARLVWLQNDGHRETHVRELRVTPARGADPATARDLAQIDGIGAYELQPDGSIVLEQGGRLVRRDYAFQDLARWDPRTGEVARLTRGARARDPAVSPDGRWLAFSQNGPGESVLAMIPAGPVDRDAELPVRVVWRGQPREQAFQPAWSPDGSRIAFSAWRRGGYRDILVVDVATGGVREVTADRAIDMAPAWSADGRTLYFDSDRTGIANIYAYDVASAALWQVTNVLGGAFQPHPSPDGARLVYQGAVPAGGYDLFELPIDRATWLTARPHVDDRPPPTVVRDDEAPVTEPRRYRALETLAPRAWTLQTALGGTPSATIQTSGTDALGLHAYTLAVTASLKTADLSVSGAYGFRGWRWNWRIAAARTVGDRGGLRIDGVPRSYRQEELSATLSSGLPFEARPGGGWSMTFDYDVDVFRAARLPPIPLDPGDRVPVRPLTDYVQAGIGTRLAYSRVRGTTYGVGPQQGFDAAVALRIDHPALGAKYRAVTVSYSTQHFRAPPVPWRRRPAVALRLAGSLRAGDLGRGGAFGLGGVPAQDVARAILESTRAGTIGYLRGYRARAISGNQVHLANLELRQELWAVERGLATLPVYLRRVHLGLLADAGAAFDTRFDAERSLKRALGAALRLDAFFGYFVPGTFEVGVSRGLDRDGITEGWLLLTGTL